MCGGVGYGLTETSPVITASMVGWKDRRLGCVGRALDGVTVKIMNPEGVGDVMNTYADIGTYLNNVLESNNQFGVSLYRLVYYVGGGAFGRRGRNMGIWRQCHGGVPKQQGCQ